MIISLCNCRCQCLTLFLILKQRRYIIGRETLYIFIDGFCNVLRVRNSLDDSLCSQYDVTCREDTGACRLSVFVRKEKTVLGGLKVSCGVHKLGLRSLAYGNDRRIGPEEFRFVFSRYDITLVIEDVFVENRAVVCYFEGASSEEEFGAVEFCILSLLLTRVYSVTSCNQCDVPCALSQQRPRDIHCGVADSDDCDVVSEMVGVGVGKKVDCEVYVSEALP